MKNDLPTYLTTSNRFKVVKYIFSALVMVHFFTNDFVIFWFLLGTFPLIGVFAVFDQGQKGILQHPRRKLMGVIGLCPICLAVWLYNYYQNSRLPPLPAKDRLTRITATIPN